MHSGGSLPGTSATQQGRARGGGRVTLKRQASIRLQMKQSRRLADCAASLCLARQLQEGLRRCGGRASAGGTGGTNDVGLASPCRGTKALPSGASLKSTNPPPACARPARPLSPTPPANARCVLASNAIAVPSRAPSHPLSC